jgi:collagenase-like PrtC family protease
MSNLPKSRLTLGPILFHWPNPRRRDFYARIADEAPIDCVYLGEAVCSKRLPWFEKDLPEIAERLLRAGKEVVFSTPALITTEQEAKEVQAFIEAGKTVEINDLACLALVRGRRFVSGPLINVFHERALDVLRNHGAWRVNMPVELTAGQIATLARHHRTGETEVFAFGRQPLAISQRCYHARAHNLHKDNCQFVCGLDADGLEVSELNGRALFAINGTQTLSHGFLVLLDALAELQAAGVSHFRLSPHTLDMVEVAWIYRAVLDGTCSVEEANARLAERIAPIPFINGYLHARPGREWQPARPSA